MRWSWAPPLWPEPRQGKSPLPYVLSCTVKDNLLPILCNRVCMGCPDNLRQGSAPLPERCRRQSPSLWEIGPLPGGGSHTFQCQPWSTTEAVVCMQCLGLLGGRRFPRTSARRSLSAACRSPSTSPGAWRSDGASSSRCERSFGELRVSQDYPCPRALMLPPSMRPWQLALELWEEAGVLDDYIGGSHDGYLCDGKA
jgi:hypothetical protein